MSVPEPYDEAYLKSCDPPIKFTSFHAHLRKLTGGVTKDKYVFLENLSCVVKPNCPEHPPYPKGLCSKCQPRLAIEATVSSLLNVDASALWL